MKNAIFVTLSNENSALMGPDNTYFADTYVNIPNAWILHNTAIALLDVEGYIVPRFENKKSFYLCADFVENSMIQLDNDQVGMFPVLRRLTLDKTRIKVDNVVTNASGIQETFSQLIYIPCSRQEVFTFRLYLIDTQGEMVSFDNFTLRCTLLTFPQKN